MMMMVVMIVTISGVIVVSNSDSWFAVPSPVTISPSSPGGKRKSKHNEDHDNYNGNDGGSRVVWSDTPIWLENITLGSRRASPALFVVATTAISNGGGHASNGSIDAIAARVTNGARGVANLLFFLVGELVGEDSSKEERAKEEVHVVTIFSSQVFSVNCTCGCSGGKDKCRGPDPHLQCICFSPAFG